MAKVSLAEQVEILVDLTTSVYEGTSDDYEMTVFRVSMRESADGTSTVAMFLNTVSTAYMKVSSGYILGQLAGITQLLSIADPKAQTARLAQLERESARVQDEITAICVSHKASFTSMCLIGPTPLI